MNVPLEHGNILKHKNDVIRSNLASVERIHIYEFDNALFRTPLPNAYLFNSDSIDLMTKNPDPLSKFNWFSSVRVLKEVGKTRVDETSLNTEGLWNEILRQLIVDSNEDRNTLTILSVTRIPELFTSMILRLLKTAQLDDCFDCILMNEDPNYLDLVVSATTPLCHQLKEITVYAATKQLQVDGVGCLNIAVPFESSYLLPQLEVAIVQEMLLGEPFQLRRSIFSSYYMLSPESRQELLRRTVTEDFILPEDRPGLFFEGEGVLIGKNQLSQSKLDELGGISKPVIIGAVSLGSIKGRIYAMRVIINDENAQTYLQPPVIVIARKPDVLLKEVEQIENWQTTRELFSLEARIEYKQIFKIQSEQQ
ncbi:hypothetical protein KL912_002326 [Ogataea haglerorum]|nr:hypothetical protein KL912_002326 [Ogataea haglerorum]